MIMRTKNYNKTAGLYAERLRSVGYTVRFNWVDDGQQYEDVTVCGPVFRGYGREFSTPREAWEYVRRQH